MEENNMAGNIQKVNLAKLESEIREYDTLARKLHDNVTEICNSIRSFTTCWSGQRINKVITMWNQNYKTIDNEVFYFTMKIHLILLEIRDQYEAMEKGAPRDSSYGYGWGGINKIQLTDASTIRFEQSKAETIVKNIQTNVVNARSCLKNLVSKLNSMQAYSDSLKTLATTYKTNASKCETSLSNLCNSIQTEANKALNDVKTTEGYNEKDAKRATNYQSK